jgi:non-ribosomal peptide synthetase component F
MSQHVTLGCTIFEHVLQAEAATPDKIAVYCPHSPCLSFSQLVSRANKAKEILLSTSTELDLQNSLVLVRVIRNASSVVALLGILAGCFAYTPIDPEHPIERQRLVANESRARIAVVSLEASTDMFDLSSFLRVLVIIDSHGNISDVRHKDEVIQPGTDGPQLPAGLAYVMFTSGR